MADLWMVGYRLYVWNVEIALALFTIKLSQCL